MLSSTFFTPSLDDFAALSFKSNRSIYLLNLSVLKSSYTFSLSHFCTFKSSIFSSIGTAKLIVPKVLERIAKSLFSSIFSLVFPFIVSAFPASNSLYILSILPYFWINESAVFSPIPGTPGILSEESPWSPFTSINWIGSKPPYTSFILFLSKSSTSVFPIFVRGILTQILSEVNWNVSLSPERMVTFIPSFSALFERVPKTSSAS